jgi:hypothetical protein
MRLLLIEITDAKVVFLARGDDWTRTVTAHVWRGRATFPHLLSSHGESLGDPLLDREVLERAQEVLTLRSGLERERTR